MDVLAKRYPLAASAGGGVVIGILTAFVANLILGMIVGGVSAIFFWFVIRYFNDADVE